MHLPRTPTGPPHQVLHLLDFRAWCSNPNLFLPIIQSTEKPAHLSLFPSISVLPMKFLFSLLFLKSFPILYKGLENRHQYSFLGKFFACVFCPYKYFLLSSDDREATLMAEKKNILGQENVPQTYHAVASSINFLCPSWLISITDCIVYLSSVRKRHSNSSQETGQAPQLSLTLTDTSKTLGKSQEGQGRGKRIAHWRELK